MMLVAVLAVLILHPAIALLGEEVPGGPRGEGTKPWGDSTGYTREVTMDVDGKFTVKWDIDVELNKITFYISVETAGWIGFGLSSNGGMVGADIIMAWIKDGVSYFSDRHGIGESIPVVDESQDWELVEITETSTKTKFIVRRDLDTCDEHDKVIVGGTIRLVYAYGDEDPHENDAMSTNVIYHGAQKRGSKSVFLTSDKPPKPDIPDSSIIVDLIVQEYEVPAADTTYWCELFKAPKLDRKHQMIKITPLIEKGNEGFVHHIILFGCHGSLSDEFHGYRSICNSPNMPNELLSCNEFIFVWSIGAGDFYWPEKAGFSIAGGDSDPDFFVMEMHYDNPALKTGMRDRSGLRLVMTPELREFDAGLLQQGHRYDGPWQNIPPNFPSISQYGHCPGECTKQAFENEPDGIYLFAALLHLHVIGQSMRLRHFRGGEELPLISSDEEYDFNLQETRHIYPAVNIKPGDSLVSECMYKSSKMKNFTLSGLSTSEEMCLSFIMYYPRVPLTQCESYTDMGWVTKQMTDVTNIKHDPSSPPYEFVQSPEHLAGKSHLDVLNMQDWTDPDVRDVYQKLIDRAPMRINCAKPGGFYWEKGTPMKNICVERKKIETSGSCPSKEELPARCDLDDLASSAPNHVKIKLLVLLALTIVVFNF